MVSFIRKIDVMTGEWGEAKEISKSFIVIIEENNIIIETKPMLITKNDATIFNLIVVVTA